MLPEKTPFQHLQRALADRSAKACVIGLGYVGLPLAVAIARSAFTTIGLDIDPAKPISLNAGKSYIAATSGTELKQLVDAGRFRASNDFSEIAQCDVVIICVPTPLTRHREPDLSYIESTAHMIARYLHPGQLVVLESTTYPGTTREVLKPVLEATGLVAGQDFFVGFSPEREDPGNTAFDTVTIPKVVAGDGENAAMLIEMFYGAFLNRIVPVSSPDTAEAVKITENIFRAVNIALVNELKVIYAAMGIDIWEVVEAAKTKPFGYMPFYPGPGLGGHCIPIDPFYLSWKARELEMPTRFIELAGEINISMPRYVIDVLGKSLDSHLGITLGAARILIIGLAYKKNVPDIRESPTFKLMELLEQRGAQVEYHDPNVTEIPPTREHANYAGRRSVTLDAATLETFDAVLISTDHDAIDYEKIHAHAKLVVDTRNVMARRGITAGHIVKA